MKGLYSSSLLSTMFMDDTSYHRDRSQPDRRIKKKLCLLQLWHAPWPWASVSIWCSPPPPRLLQGFNLLSHHVVLYAVWATCRIQLDYPVQCVCVPWYSALPWPSRMDWLHLFDDLCGTFYFYFPPLVYFYYICCACTEGWHGANLICRFKMTPNWVGLPDAVNARMSSYILYLDIAVLILSVSTPVWSRLKYLRTY